MKIHLLVLFSCLFVVMIGLGIIMPVLPFYVERLAETEGLSKDKIVFHVGSLTAVYALGQLIFAFVWGRLSDRIGRRPLLLVGIAGYVVSQIFFGVSTSLWMLYAARIFGGVFSSATLPVSSAYVADLTNEKDRSRGMAWLGTAVSLGFVVGPALGGYLAKTNLHFNLRFWHWTIDGFSVPFFTAAALGICTFFAAALWLPESLSQPISRQGEQNLKMRKSEIAKILGPFLALSFAAQVGLSLFESTFAIYSQEKWNYGPTDVATAFMVCGLVMTVFQLGAVGFLAERMSEISKMSLGFGVMGISIPFFVLVTEKYAVLALVALIALGFAFVSPNLTSLISKQNKAGGIGALLGAQNTATSLGLASGPLVGSMLFIWEKNAPFVLTGGFLAIVALLTAWWGLKSQVLNEFKK